MNQASKSPLTRDRILAEAVAFADEFGVERLTMRTLARRLDAGAMSLYNHVANKDDMIEGMVDLICAEIQMPAPDAEWRDSMRASSASAHQVLLSHPWAAAEWTSRMPGPARLRYMDSVLRVLASAHLSASLVYHGYHAITMHVVGFTMQELGYLAVPDGFDLDVMAKEFLAGLGKENLPHLAEHVMAHVSADDYGDEFGFVLDLILDGIERAKGA